MATFESISGGSQAALRKRNRELLLRALLERIGSGRTQAELATATELSRPSIGSLLDTFKPILTETQPTRSAGGAGAKRGRAGALYDIDRSATWAAAIDIGRRHIYVGACDLHAAGDEIDEVEEPEPCFDIITSPLQTLERAAELLDRLLDENPSYDLARLCGLVVGLPGPVADGHPRDRVLDWGELDVEGAIREALRGGTSRWRERSEDLEVIVDNDANLSTIAEHRLGVGVGKSDIFYIKWSTGLGAGLICDGRLLRGGGGAAGEFGHIPVPTEHQSGVVPCDVCGNPCFESAIGFKPLLKERGWSYRDVQRIGHDPQHPDYVSLRDWIEPRAELLGRALVPVANVLNPQLVIIDGILDAAMEPLFVRGILRSLEQHGAMSTASSDLKVRGGRFTVSAAAKGGLALAFDEFAPKFLLAQ